MISPWSTKNWREVIKNSKIKMQNLKLQFKKLKLIYG